MRKISVQIGITAAFALALVGFSISQPYAQGQGMASGGAQLTVNCDAGQVQGQGQSIQATVDVAGDGDTITVSGTCTEIVTITTDGITVRGGTLLGGFIVDGAQRVVIDNLTIDGSTNSGLLDGVRATNNAHVTVRNSTIENHTLNGVNVTSTSSALIEGNTIGNHADYGVIVSSASSAVLRGTAENPTQTITSAAESSRFGAALGVFNSSSAILNGGNFIEGTGAAPVVSVFTTSRVRVQNGLNTITSTPPPSTLPRAIQIGRLSVLTLRWYVVTGRVEVFSGAHAEIRKRLDFEPDPTAPPNIEAVINGDIRVRTGGHVNFPSPFLARNGLVNQGSITVNGKLDCAGDNGHVQFGTGFDQTIEDVFGAFATNPPSQCKDFNGNEIFPPL